MSQDTTKESGTKRKTTPTKRSVEPLKETTAEHVSGAVKISPTKKDEKPQVDKKSQSGQKPVESKKTKATSKDASSQGNHKDVKPTRTARAQKSERGQRSEGIQKPHFSVASLAEIKDKALDFARNHTKLVTFLGIVIFLIVGLYSPVRGYYHAVREHDELLFNQQKLEEETKRLLQDVQRLQTKEGIIDEAHKQGMVSKDEESVRVEGLEKKKDENTAQHPDYPWYIKVGDFIFGFSPENSGNTEAPKSANSDDPTSAPAPGESHEQKNSGGSSSSEGSGGDNSQPENGNSH